MASKIIQPGKWHGGKRYLASKIIGLFPPRCRNPNKPDANDAGYLHYVEPYFGMGAVLLANDPEGISEVVSDINGGLINFWHVLQDERLFKKFRRLCEATPFSQAEFERTATWPDHCSSVKRAWRFFILCRQSLAGRMKGFTGITKTRTRRGMNNEVSAWLTTIEGLSAVHARLKRVLILNRPALDVIRANDGPRTLTYADPPYVHEARATRAEYGGWEMSDQDHIELLSTLTGLKGFFFLSGYPSRLYDSFFKDFPHVRHEFKIPNQAAGGKKKRLMTECVWTNYRPDQAQRRAPSPQGGSGHVNGRPDAS